MINCKRLFISAFSICMTVPLKEGFFSNALKPSFQYEISKTAKRAPLEKELKHFFCT